MYLINLSLNSPFFGVFSASTNISPELTVTSFAFSIVVFPDCACNANPFSVSIEVTLNVIAPDNPIYPSGACFYNCYCILLISFINYYTI